MKVFISYSQENKPLARCVLQALKKAGLDVWDDEYDIYPGDNWAKVTGEALEEAEAMVVLLTREALDSTRVLQDIEFAVANIRFKDRLVPVLIGSHAIKAMEKVPWIIRHLNVVTMPSNGKQEEGIDQITQTLKAVA